jgi:hypothetical protein
LNKHEEIKTLLTGNDKEQNELITLPMLLSKLKEYQGGKLLFLHKEEYIDMQQYITQAEATEKAHEELKRDVNEWFTLTYKTSFKKITLEQNEHRTAIFKKLSKVGDSNE